MCRCGECAAGNREPAGMNVMIQRAGILWLFVTLSACSSLGATTADRIGTPGCETAARSLSSGPGRAWMQEQGWRYRSVEEAASAYANLADTASPWPDWLPPQETVLAPGTRFQMAIGGEQTAEQPGSFGTFDNIDEVEDVRSGLAVRIEWKPEVDRVVTYEVTQAIPVRVGPVGPQIDGGSCRLLWGRWSQLQMLVPTDQRMAYLKVVGIRPIR
jgi:hypothetical protein